MTTDRRKDKQRMGHPYKEILFSNQEEKKTIDPCENMHQSQKLHTVGKKPNVKVLTLYNFIYTKFFLKVILTYGDKKSEQFLPLRYSGAAGWKGPYENLLG